jgi:outer membrane lipase/esterase
MASSLQRSRLRWLVLVAGFLVVAASGSSQAAVSYSSLYVFGDSLTDSGNVSIFTSGSIPPAAYTDGTFSGRFTNGLNFADVLANKLFSTSNGLKPVLAGGTNYAVGGATTGTGNVADALFPGPHPATGMTAQLRLYQATAGSQGADPKALYLVYGGANDMISMLSAALPELLTDPPGAVALKNQAITAAVGNLRDILNGLAGAGATSFLVPNLPDLGSTPRLVNTPGKSFAQQASEDFNTALDAMLSTFGSSHPGINSQELDVFAALNDVLANSDTTFANKTMGCYPGDPFSPPPTAPTCTDPDQHVFWDDIHPTSAAHALLGEEAFRVVTVPEPQTWALLLVGLALLSGIARRKRLL